MRPSGDSRMSSPAPLSRLRDGRSARRTHHLRHRDHRSGWTPLIAIIPAYSGRNLDDGERLLGPLRACGPGQAGLVTRTSYLALQQMLDGATPHGIRSYWKSTFLASLPDEAIDTFVHWASLRPSARTNVAWTRDFHQAMQPWSSALVYVNALAADDGARVRQAYGDNYARLVDVKTRYDPANLFRRNQNITPTTPSVDLR